MTKEGRVVALISMTVLLYGLNTFFQTGSLVFPFPLNELFFLLGSVFIGFYSYKNEMTTVLTTIYVAITGVLSQEFYWSIFLSPERMELFSNSLYRDTFQVLHYIGILMWLILIWRKSIIHVSIYFLVIILFTLVTAFYLDIIILQMFVYLSVFLYFFKSIQRYPSLNLWFLYCVLVLAKYWSLNTFS